MNKNSIPGITTFTLLLLLISGSFQAFPQSLATQRCNAFGKGMNLSNWLEAPWQTNWPTPDGYTRNDLVLMKEAGIQSIRLPVCFARIVDSVAPYNVNTNHLLFTRIDTVIQWVAELQMNLIIDNHHEWILENNNWRNNQKRFAHLWGVLASRYQNLDPDHYTFELLNEPALLFPLDSLNIIFNTAIDSIRNYTSSHTIIVSPNVGSEGISYSEYLPLADTNLIYTWHCYDPLNFTHQGFSWSTPVFPTGTPFPATPISFYEQFLYDGIYWVNHWRDTFNLPVFLGEFGVSEHADEQSRCNWIGFMGHELDSAHIPWFYWDWRWDFSMFRSHVISADSVIPCFAHALHLYGDTTISAVNPNLEDPSPEIKFYPNIISGNTTCYLDAGRLSYYTIKIFDSSGRQVREQHFNQSKEAMTLNLETGMYYVQLTTPQGRVVQKLISY